jgi:hypothetical protein
MLAYRNLLSKAVTSLLLRMKGHRIIARDYATPTGAIPFVSLQDNRLAFIVTEIENELPADFQ